MTSRPMQPPTPQHPAEPFAPPHKVDKFRLLRPLGRGGMGQVYLAYDEMLERQVALKFVAAIRPGLEQRERFLIEARAIARIHHPNVVTIYSVGEYDGIPYLVSEYVDGCSLAQVGKPLPSPKVLRIAIELARGLDAAHQRGVLHRDVKPGNILLSKTDEVKLVDFGLAKLRHDNFGNAADTPFPGPVVVHRSPPSADLAQTISLVEKVAERSRNWIPQHIPGLSAITHPGARMGTPLYMAPELWRGEQGTARSDIYSLGAVLYELAYGRPPHEAPSAAQLECLVLDTDAVPLLHRAPSLDPQLAQIIDSCLRRSPAERPSSAQELCAQLETLGMPDEVSSVPDGNPYRGLRPFEPTDRGLLFGRRQDVASVVDQLRMQPFVLITGDSGVGKSSLCRAGVLPSIRDGVLNEERNWSILSMIPGRWPLHAMADALGPLLRIPHGELVTALANEPAKLTIELSRKLGTHYGLLLFIDQLEEVVTQSSPADARILGEFLSHLTQRLPGVRVLAAVRGDFLTRVAERTHLSYELSHAVYLLRPLTTPDLREVIEGPARIKGVRFENEAMIESMVRSTESAEGGLPLLQFTLAQLWEKRDVPRGIILASSLKEMGGVEGSLSSYTESVLSRMLPEQVEAARRILIRLVRSDGTRICRSEEELVTGDPAELIALDVLVQSRLLVAKRQSASRNNYELAHEALLSGWSRLRDWLSHDREERAVLERAEAAALEWERFGHRHDLLWREPQILEFDRFCPHRVASRIEHFMDASRLIHRKQKLATRLMITAALMGMIVLGIAVARVWQQRADSLKVHRDEIIRIARQPGREIEALAEAVQRSMEDRGGKIVPEIEEALRDVMATPGRAFPAIHHAEGVNWVEFSPDGKRLLTAGGDGTAKVWDAASRDDLLLLSGHGGSVLMARFSPGGDWIASGSSNGTLRIWNAATGKLHRTIDAHRGEVRFVQYSSSGKHVLTLGGDGHVALWLGKTGEQLIRIRNQNDPILVASYSPDASVVVTGTQSGMIQFWSTSDGKCMRQSVAHSMKVTVLNFSTSGAYIVSGSADATGKVWDTKTGRLLVVLRDHYSPLVSAEFSADEQNIVTAASEDVSARLWDAKSGVRLSRLEGHVSPLKWATFSPDGQRIATMGLDHTVRLWHGRSGAWLVTYRGHHAEVRFARFAPDSQKLATMGGDGMVQLWREQIGSSISLSKHRGPVWDFAISPDGQTFATAGTDCQVYLWDVKTGEFLKRFGEQDGAILSVTFSADGKWLATGGFGAHNNLTLWNLADGSKNRLLHGHQERVQRVAFSPDSSMLLSVGFDNRAILWSVSNGAVIHVLNKHTNAVVYGGFSRLGTSVFTGSKDTTAMIWDTQSGKLHHTLREHKGVVWFVDESPDRKWLVTTSEDNTAALWERESGRLSKVLKGHTDWVASASFSTDGHMLATAGFDGIGMLWEVPTGRFLRALIGHGEGIWKVRFSPNGDRILTASSDHTARLWDAVSGRPLGVLRGHLGPIMNAAFTPNGQQIVTTSTDATIKLFPAEPVVLLQHACRILRRWSEHADIWQKCDSLPKE